MSTNKGEQQYLDLMQKILDEGVKQTDKGSGVVTHSLFGYQMRFDLADGFPLLTTKKVYWRGVLHELYWFLSGQSNIKYLVDNKVHIWDDYPYRIYKEMMTKGEVPEMTKEEFITKIESDDDFAETYGDLKNIYGELWRRWPATDGRKIDQLQWIVDTINSDPDCHNAVLNAWHPEFLYEMGADGVGQRFPICHNMFQCNVKDGKLSLHLYQRSADIFLGVPFNIASYALLAHVLAKITGYEVGEYIHTFGDVHVYDDHIEQAREQISRETFDFPTVSISDEATSLEAFKPEHVTLENYESHKTIKAKLAPVGGAKSEEWEEHMKEQDNG